MITIKTLLENTGSRNRALAFEHGLSFFVTVDNKSYLFDCSGGDKFIKNARKMNIDLSKIDTVICSHSHYDHSCGFLDLVDNFKIKKLITGKNYFDPKYSFDGMKYTYLGCGFNKDFLEDNVGEKYYLSEKMIKCIASNGEKWTGNNNKSLINKSIASTINTREGSRRCDASNFIAPDLEGEDIDLKPIIAKRKEFKKLNNTNDKTHLRIRRLTPKECFRLQGFDDKDVESVIGGGDIRHPGIQTSGKFNKCASYSSNTKECIAIYKQLNKGDGSNEYQRS